MQLHDRCALHVMHAWATPASWPDAVPGILDVVVHEVILSLCVSHCLGLVHILVPARRCPLTWFSMTCTHDVVYKQESCLLVLEGPPWDLLSGVFLLRLSCVEGGSCTFPTKEGVSRTFQDTVLSTTSLSHVVSDTLRCLYGVNDDDVLQDTITCAVAERIHQLYRLRRKHL